MTENKDTASDAPAFVAYNNGTEEREDQLSRLSQQLNALLFTMIGEGFKNFSAQSNEIQQNVLWLAHDLAEQMDSLMRGREVAHG